MVDARIPKEFEDGSIPGSVSIPYDNVLNASSSRARISSRRFSWCSKKTGR